MKKLLYTSLFLNLLVVSGIIYALINIGSPRYLFNLIKYRGQGIVSIKKHRTELFKMLPKTEGKTVMLGNSITALCEWSELLGDSSIINRGIMGDGTGDILNRLDDVVALKPKKIFLLIGVNDLMYNPLSKIAENYEKIVARIKQDCPTTKLYLESVLPIHNDLRRTGMRNEDIDNLNLKIKEIAERNQLIYLDLNSKFKSTEGALKEEFSLDGIHLTGQGYLLFKDLIKTYVSE